MCNVEKTVWKQGKWVRIETERNVKKQSVQCSQSSSAEAGMTSSMAKDLTDSGKDMFSAETQNMNLKSSVACAFCFHGSDIQDAPTPGWPTHSPFLS